MGFLRAMILEFPVCCVSEQSEVCPGSNEKHISLRNYPCRIWGRPKVELETHSKYLNSCYKPLPFIWMIGKDRKLQPRNHSLRLWCATFEDCPALRWEWSLSVSSRRRLSEDEKIKLSEMRKDFWVMHRFCRTGKRHLRRSLAFMSASLLVCRSLSCLEVWNECTHATILHFFPRFWSQPLLGGSLSVCWAFTSGTQCKKWVYTSALVCSDCFHFIGKKTKEEFEMTPTRAYIFFCSTSMSQFERTSSSMSKWQSSSTT